jgi:putative mycofactocin binding protein MftB
MDLDRGYAMSARVALRPEPFGALAYHYGNRRLVFLKTPELVEVVRNLGEHQTATAALTAAGVPADQWRAYRHALASLEAAEVIHARGGRAIA